MSLGTERDVRMSFAHKLQYVAADMNAFPWRIGLVLSSLVIPVVFLLVLGFYGKVTYLAQARRLADSGDTVVKAECGDVMDLSQRFTLAKVDEIRRLPGVRLAYPYVEIGVRASLDGGTSILLLAEGTIPQDPAFQPARLAWGRSVREDAADEVVIGDSLLRKLGAEVGVNGPTPASILLQVNRTSDGDAERQTLEFTIVGVRLHHADDRVYVSVPTAERLDMWCAGKIDRVRAEEPDAESREPGGDADPLSGSDYVNAVLRGVSLRIRAQEPLHWIDIEREDSQTSLQLDDAAVPEPAPGEILLPAFVAEEALPGVPAEEVVGRNVTLEIVPDGMEEFAEPVLPLVFRIAGLVDRIDARCAPELFRDVAAWSRGELAFDESRGVFELPEDVHNRGGHLRCKVEAMDPGGVAPLVAALERRGYRTESRLGEIEGLRTLGQVIRWLVALLVFGYLASTLLTVPAASALDIRSKMRDIGILRAHGLGCRDVVTLFGLEALIVGLGAFVSGSAIAVALEPVVRSLIEKVSGIGFEAMRGESILSARMADLYVAAFVLTTVISTLSVVLPVIGISRQLPVHALRGER
jgi:hypothetical protein